MKPFKTHKGSAIAFLRINIDTDAIIPSREINKVSKLGLGKSLFAEWRYMSLKSKKINKDFILNQSIYENASILLTGDNFGCGSSREHAVWAIQQWGFRVIIAPSFGTIFYNNCIKNGLLPIVLDAQKIESLKHFIEINPIKNQLKIDLSKKIITFEKNNSFHFSKKKKDQDFLINGLGQIDLTLKEIDQIDAFEKNHLNKNSWL